MQVIADSTHGQFALQQQSNQQSQWVQLSLYSIVLQQPKSNDPIFLANLHFGISEIIAC